MNKLWYLVKSMRPHQWYKNLIVFIGLIFSKNILSPELWYEVSSVFVLLCIFSGVTYIVNDVVDAERDARHPRKRRRPIASGRIRKHEALFGALVLFVLASYWAFTLSQETVEALIVFLGIGFLYNFYLKNIFIVDIITISVLFVLRAIIGVIVINVEVSQWLILCTFLLALMLALGKRRKELEMLKEESIYHRKVLEHYSLEIINPLVISTLAILYVSYCIYSVLTETGREMVITIPVMTYLLFRYTYLIFSESDVPSNPERVFMDKGMVYGMIFWVALVLVSLYVL